jgi:hypothetical protein
LLVAVDLTSNPPEGRQKMRACRWMFVAVLALGMALQSSGSAAEGPAEEIAPAAPIAFALGASQCEAPAQALGLEPVEPMFLSCSAQATCSDGSPLACSSPSGSCTGVDGSCPQDGYVQCGSTFIPCPAFCPPPPQDCVLSCSVNSNCTSYCGGPGVCVTGCNPSKPAIKKCVCIA